jgi:hypothetical protein
VIEQSQIAWNSRFSRKGNNRGQPELRDYSRAFKCKDGEKSTMRTTRSAKSHHAAGSKYVHNVTTDEDRQTYF